MYLSAELTDLSPKNGDVCPILCIQVADHNGKKYMIYYWLVIEPPPQRALGLSSHFVL